MLMSRVRSFLIMMLLAGVTAAVLPARGAVNTPLPADDKAAIVNGAVIGRGDFDGEVLLAQKALLSAGKSLTCSRVAAIGKDVMESMIRRELLYQESRKAGIKADQAAVNKELDVLKKQFPSEAEYRNELARRNLAEDALRARLERNLAVEQYIERQFAGKAVVGDREMVAYYENRLDLFKQPLQVRVSHILVQTDPKGEEARTQEARRKAEQILKNLKKGQDFAALAREQSDGPTRMNGGDLGYIRPGQLEKQLEDAVFSLKTGETSGIVETAYGFHIFQVKDRKPETVLAYDAVKEQIRQYLQTEKARQDADLYAKTLREKASVETFLREDASVAKKP